MTTETRIYHITVKSRECNEDMLVKATSRSQAIRFAAKGHITCDIPKPIELVAMIQAGVKVVDAGAEPETEAE